VDKDGIKALFQYTLGTGEGYLCVAFLNARTKYWQEEFYSYPSDMDTALKDIERNMLTTNVYFCPTLLTKPQRIKENVALSRVAWADLDECDYRRMKVEPTMVLETSPERYQAFWTLVDYVPASEVELVNQSIAYTHKEHGADTSGWDLTQMLRVPGTKNHKSRPDLYDIKVVLVNPENLYELEDLVREYPPGDNADVSFPEMGAIHQLGDGNSVFESHRAEINPRAWTLFAQAPTGDWSKNLWQLELLLFAAGLSREEVFVVARDSACNKYKRDGRSETLLWKEVCRAQANIEAKPAHAPTDDGSVEEAITWVPPMLITDDERDYCNKHPTFVEEYIEWAKTIGDAAWQYHQAGAFVILSSLLSGTVRLPTSFGTVIPNLWFMILADTTLTRKSTAMDMAMDMLLEVDPDCVLATDGSIEGLLTSLSMRPGRPSIFLRDEFSGLLEMITKRDYYAGMLETLTKLYDGKFQKRVLRKETLEVRDPVLVLFAGGIKDRILQLLSYEHIDSGFVPRFCFITAESDVTRLRPLGPPTERTMGIRHELIERMRRMKDYYVRPVSQTELPMPMTWEAQLTPGAWQRYNRIENDMMQAALDSNIPSLLSPTFARLCISGLKAAVLLAAAEREADAVMVTEMDLVRSFYYIEQWMSHTMYIIANAGKTSAEHTLDKVLKMITDHPDTPRSRVMQNMRLNAREAENIFLTLEQRGHITRRKNGRGEVFRAIDNPLGRR
jgi:hypothetical protein